MKAEKPDFAGFSLLLSGDLQGPNFRPRLKISYRVILNLTFKVTEQTWVVDPGDYSLDRSIFFDV
jgi:hypothetical protein